MTARTRTDILLLAGFCAFLFFYGLGQFGLIGADEPRYAQVAREMLERHDWVTPTLGSRPWLEKPPLYYWQAILAYKLFGITDVAARMPSAIDATLLVIVVYLFFRKFRHGVEIDAALVTASCAGTIGFARAASTDMPLAAFFGIGMLAWWSWHATGRKSLLAAFYVCMALGTLAKGPVAPLLAAIVIIAWAALVSEWRVITKTLWLPGIALFIGAALPWYVAVQMRNPQFFREFILQHNLARFSTNLYHHPEPFWYYVPVTALALVPWTVFIITALVESVRVWWDERKNALDSELQFRIFACCWLIAPVIFFSLSRSKLPGYILPAVPAGAVLLADYLLRQIEHDLPVPRWIAIAHAIVASSPVVPAVLIGFAVTQHRLPFDRLMLFALALTAILCIAITLTLLGRMHWRMLRFVTLIPVVLAVAAVLKLGTTAIDGRLSARPLAAELASVETHQLPLAVCGTSRELEYGLAFYRNQTIARYESGDVPAREHLVVASSSWKDQVVKDAAGRRVSFLGSFEPQSLDYFWVSAGQK